MSKDKPVHKVTSEQVVAGLLQLLLDKKIITDEEILHTINNLKIRDQHN